MKKSGGSEALAERIDAVLTPPGASSAASHIEDLAVQIAALRHLTLDNPEIVNLSAALSLKRIADAMELSNRLHNAEIIASGGYVDREAAGERG